MDGRRNGNGRIDRNTKIVALHTEGRMTLSEIAEKVGLTRERVRQIVRAEGVLPSVTQEILEERRSRRRIVWKCAGCGKQRRLTPSRARSRKFCSRECASQNAHFKYSRRWLKEHLRALAEMVGRTPSMNDINSSAGPAHMTYVHRFGSLRAAQAAAGLKPNQWNQES